jgi:hypothetical protein
VVFYQAINRRYGAKWDMLLLPQFGDCCLYVQIRIDNTALGRNMKARGQRNYSSFPEHCAKFLDAP